VNLFRGTILFGLRLYRWVISPVLSVLAGPGCGCRYHPTCSVYAMEAVKRFGVWRGGWLTVKRLARCHPWGGFGDDPVPDRVETSGRGKAPPAPGWAMDRATIKDEEVGQGRLDWA
jgi:putative membrane protein insertion efficiency factor